MPKEYDFIVSLGRDCACSMYLRDHKLQSMSYPFDWLTHDASLVGCLDIRFELILNNFRNFLNIEDLRFLPKDPKVRNDEKNDYYENVRNKLYFYHDFVADERLIPSFSKVKAKYNRRIRRFYSSTRENAKVLFVWFAHQPNIDDNSIIKYSDRINQKFGKTIDFVIIENDANHPINDEFTTVQLSSCVTKYVLNTYPKNVDNKTKGNEQLCNQIFRLYRLNTGFTTKFQRFVTGALLALTPVKSWRKKLRKLPLPGFRFFRARVCLRFCYP